MKRLVPWIPALVAALVGAWVWRPLLELELLGWDSYPMIAAGRVEGFGGVFTTFGEELMDGRMYPLTLRGLDEAIGELRRKGG